MAFLLLVISATARFDWERDNAILRATALDAVRRAYSQPEAIVALNHWVYLNQGFAKNRNYFLLKKLGPTPVQVLREGGDCADKSRLLSAMLFQIGIRSSLVMIYPCLDCSAIHTVVEAYYEKGRMVVDPIWDVVYPAAHGGYYGVRELANTAFSQSRISELKAQNTKSAKIWKMNPADAVFDYATAINWRKNAVTRTVAAVLRTLHVEPSSVPRPRIFEDPQLAIWLVTLLGSICLFGIAFVVPLLANEI